MEPDNVSNPDESRGQFAAAVAGLRGAFDRFVAAKEEQFEQFLELGGSGMREDAIAFLKDLEQECERLQIAAIQMEIDNEDLPEIIQQEMESEEREQMKSIWRELFDKGVPKDQWPISAYLTWADQFQAQAEVELTGKHKGESAGLAEKEGDKMTASSSKSERNIAAAQRPKSREPKFITRVEAQHLAERHFWNQNFDGANVLDGATAKLWIYNPGTWSANDVWVVYKNPKQIAIKSSEVILVCKHTGRVLYEGSAGDEG